MAENEDGDMEVQKAGSYNELGYTRATFTSPPRSPPGHPNMYGKMTTPFAASVQLNDLGPISDTLVSRRRWNDPEVHFFAFDLLLDKGATVKRLEEHGGAQHLKSWRKLATAQVKQKWNVPTAPPPITFLIGSNRGFSMLKADRLRTDEVW